MTAPLTWPGLAAVVERADFWRRSPATVGGRAGHKEWQYFAILDEDVSLVTTFSIMDQNGLRTGEALEVPHVTALVRTQDGEWTGSVGSSAATLTAGAIDASFGESRLSFHDDGYHISLGSSCAARARVHLRPFARPAITRSVPLGNEAPMQWLVVPRLDASVEIDVGGRRYLVDRAPAYHDHNWGRFAWGGDFAWEWAIILGQPAPFSLVYYRITDRGRHSVLAQGLLAWHRHRHRRTFRDVDLRVRTSGRLETAGCLRVPTVMSLAYPGGAADIPSHLEIEARSGADALDVSVDLSDCAQIAVPNDTDDGATVMSECHGRARLSGRLNGEVVAAGCRTLVEFKRAA